MKNVTRVLSLSAIALALVSGVANAEPGQTRAQVEAQLSAAQQSGDIYFGDQGKTLREMYPERYEQGSTTHSAAVSAAPAPASLVNAATVDESARDQEHASLAAAARVGEISTGEVGMIMHELYPAPSSQVDAASASAHSGDSSQAN